MWKVAYSVARIVKIFQKFVSGKMPILILRLLRNKLLRFRSGKIFYLIIVASIIFVVCLKRNFINPETKTLVELRSYDEHILEEALKEDKDTGCQIPRLDPFAEEITKYDQKVPDLVCGDLDWVKCYLHDCSVVKKVLDITEDIKCVYQDIIYLSDTKYSIGNPKTLYGQQRYILQASDHVKVSCTGYQTRTSKPWYSYLFSSFGKTSLYSVTVKWTGCAVGYRIASSVPRPGGGPIDVLIFGYDSLSKNGFIRKMPKSYAYITKQLNATILNGYNVVGGSTPGAFFPILTGKTELELPEARKAMTDRKIDSSHFLFHKVNGLGYRTAYFEEMPNIGTFQHRFNGFDHQPADHYLLAFNFESTKSIFDRYNNWLCVGDTPRYQLMINITEQFFKLPGSHFGVTFISDVSHDDFNMISVADAATVRFLDALNTAGHLDNTLLFFMGDHGPRYGSYADSARNTFQGMLEERLPLMAIHLPRALTEKRPQIVEALAKNVDVLTTPHDIHATILDALQMKEHMNPYKIRGANLTRALSLFEPIPRSRSCSEAGILFHWCSCLVWNKVAPENPMYKRSAEEFVRFINALTESLKHKCIPRTLESISSVTMVKQTNTRFALNRSLDHVGVAKTKDIYQIKVTVNPKKGMFEATGIYYINEDRFLFRTEDVSRITAYKDESSCIFDTHPHLLNYCYCRNH